MELTFLLTIIRFLHRAENTRPYAVKAAPLSVPFHLIRSARRRDSAARGTGRIPLTARRREERGDEREEPNGTSNGDGNGEQKSRDDFYRISRYSPIGGGDYGCPALSPRGGGFVSSSSFSFSSFLVLALDCYLLPLRTENGDRLLPVSECSGRHLHERAYVCICRLAEYVGREPVTVDVYSGEHV